MSEIKLTMDDIEYVKEISQLGDLGNEIIEKLHLNPDDHIVVMKTKDNHAYVFIHPYKEGSGCEEKEINITFNCTGYLSEEIDKAAEKLLKNLNRK